MTDLPTPTRSHVGEAFDQVTGTVFTFVAVALATTVLMMGPGEAAARAAAGYRATLQAWGF